MKPLFSLNDVQQLLREVHRLAAPEQGIETERLSSTKWQYIAQRITDYFEITPQGDQIFASTTGDSLYSLFQKGASDRNRAIGVVCTYYLMKTGNFSADDVRKFQESFSRAGKWYLSDYSNRLEYILRAKEVLYKNSQEEVVAEKELVELTTVEEPPASTEISAENSFASDESITQLPAVEPPIRKRFRLRTWQLLSVISVCLVASFGYYFYRKADAAHRIQGANDPRVFLKTITPIKDRIAPCNVQFAYDVRKIKYDSLFVDYGDGEIIKLNSPTDTLDYTVVAPQGRAIKLIIDTTVVKVGYAVNSKDWYATVDNLRLADEDVQQKGRLHFPLDKIPASIIRSNREYYVRYQHLHVMDFSLDSMIYETRIKNPLTEGGITCFDASIDLGTIQGGFLSINFLTEGCGKWANIKVGESTWIGATTDLSASEIDLSNWVTIKLQVQQQRFKVYVNNVLKYDLPFKGKLGVLNHQRIIFKGTGSIDYVKVTDLKSKNIYLRDF